MSTLVLRTETAFQVVTCCICSVQFAVSEELYQSQRRNHNTWWCPLGHPQHYTSESDLEKARREAKEAREGKERAERAAASAREDAQISEALRQKAEKATKRLKQRAAGGACPCCKRSFISLARHIATKHPGFVKEAKA